ncbi:MAG: sulfatase [Saprospiraceae bacterium]|nr:sulfatase [Saprospiraceae bacterium]
MIACVFRLKLCLLIILAGCGVSPNEATQHGKPNIILFFIDDMGWQDTSVPFWSEQTPYNRLYTTPNMERLASQGMKFTQAYATPVCTPTRVSLLTGMNAARHRVTNWTLQPDQLQPMEIDHKTLEFPMWNVNGVVADQPIPHAVLATPFPKLLQEQGYQTIHVGKAHFGAIGKSGENPLNLGFDANIAGHAAGAPKSYYGRDNFGNLAEFEGTPWPVPGLDEFYGQDINLTEALTIKAKQAMNESLRSQQPFYLYLAHYTVHTPLMADQRFYQKYVDQGLDSTEAKYASMVESMDKSLGDILDFLDEKNIANNTVILFMSDNGGLSAVARGGTPHTHNTPLSSGKGSVHEGGIREPMLVKWPGRVTAGSVCQDYLIIEDFFPTILEIAGIKEYETTQTIDGVSFVPLLSGKTQVREDRSLFWHFPNEWGPTGPGIGASSTIRKGSWKLIYYHANENFELFNIGDDISERNNLLEAHSQKATELAKELGNYLKSVNAQMPRHLNSKKQVSWPDEKIIS